MERHEPAEELRYDAATQEQIIALAARLQREHQETLSGAELEAIGEEAGLDPEFVRRATEQIASERAAKTAKLAEAAKPKKAKHRTMKMTRTSPGHTVLDVLSTAVAVVAPFAWGVLGLALRDLPKENPTMQAYVMATYGVCLLVGYLARSNEAGCVLAVVLGVVYGWALNVSLGMWGFVVFILLAGLGSWIRQNVQGHETKVIVKKSVDTDEGDEA